MASEMDSRSGHLAAAAAAAHSASSGNNLGAHVIAQWLAGWLAGANWMMTGYDSVAAIESETSAGFGQRHPVAQLPLQLAHDHRRQIGARHQFRIIITIVDPLILFIHPLAIWQQSKQSIVSALGGARSAPPDKPLATGPNLLCPTPAAALPAPASSACKGETNTRQSIHTLLLYCFL